MPIREQPQEQLHGHDGQQAHDAARSPGPLLSPLTSLGSTPRLSSRSASARSSPQREAAPHAGEPDSGWTDPTLVPESTRVSPAAEEELHYDTPFGQMDREQHALYQRWFDEGHSAQPTITNLNTALGRFPDDLRSDGEPASRESSLAPETPLAGPAEALSASDPGSPVRGLDSQEAAAVAAWPHDRQPSHGRLAAAVPAAAEAGSLDQRPSYQQKRLRSGKEYGGEPVSKRRRLDDHGRDSRSRDGSPDIGL